VDEVALKKDAQQSEKEITRMVSVSIVSDSHHTFPIEIGSCSKEQIENIHLLVRQAFETLAPMRVLTFVDQSGDTRHFNTAHITCIEVRVR
jgi:hypothetical protein